MERVPSSEECDMRFEEIYSRVQLTLLIGVNEGVGINFYEIAKFTRDEFEDFRDNTEKYLFERFGGGNFKLNFYEGPSFIVTVNFKPKGEPKWRSLIPKSETT